MPEAPEAVEPVERQRGMDAERELLPTFVGPPEVRIFDIWDDISAFELAVAVRLEPEPCAELFAVGVVVGEVQTSKPQPVLSLDRGRVGTADPILVPVVI